MMSATAPPTLMRVACQERPGDECKSQCDESGMQVDLLIVGLCSRAYVNAVEEAYSSSVKGKLLCVASGPAWLPLPACHFDSLRSQSFDFLQLPHKTTRTTSQGVRRLYRSFMGSQLPVSLPLDYKITAPPHHPQT